MERGPRWSAKFGLEHYLREVSLMWKTPVPRPAALVLGLGLLLAASTVAPAALAFGPPADDVADLTISQNGSTLQDPGEYIFYTLTVKNTTIQVWDPELHRYYAGGAPAYVVVVRDTLPSGSQFLSVSADSGFSCSQASGVVTCSGGTLQMGGTGHITINANAPLAIGSYTNTAVVDPNNTVVERNEGNNATSLTLEDVAIS